MEIRDVAVSFIETMLQTTITSEQIDLAKFCMNADAEQFVASRIVM